MDESELTRLTWLQPAHQMTVPAHQGEQGTVSPPMEWKLLALKSSDGGSGTFLTGSGSTTKDRSGPDPCLT